MSRSVLQPKPRPLGILTVKTQVWQQQPWNDCNKAERVPRKLCNRFSWLGKLWVCLSDWNDALGTCLAGWCLLCAHGGKLVLKVWNLTGFHICFGHKKSLSACCSQRCGRCKTFDLSSPRTTLVFWAQLCLKIRKTRHSAWVAISRVPCRINLLPLEQADVVLCASRWMTVSKWGFINNAPFFNLENNCNF